MGIESGDQNYIGPPGCEGGPRELDPGEAVLAEINAELDIRLRSGEPPEEVLADLTRKYPEVSRESLELLATAILIRSGKRRK